MVRDDLSRGGSDVVPEPHWNHRHRGQGITMKLTKRTIDALQPKDRDFTIWDQELRGFGCRIHPSGRRTFVFKYRVGGGRNAAQRKLLLGAYGPITVDQAR